jgi:hypothetical protein
VLEYSQFATIGATVVVEVVEVEVVEVDVVVVVP